MSNFDYYQTLNVSSEASVEEIKKSYRKLALETHPDRNPGDARAEERFKKINEAYGVLSDSQKRAQYDQYRQLGYQPGRPQGTGFGYSQEEIFRDFFTSRQSQDVFSEMQKEFERMGMRFDPNFINNLFFGGKNIFFQGVIFGPTRIRVVRYGNTQTGRPQRPVSGNQPETPLDALKPGRLLQSGLSLLGKAGRKAGAFLLKKALGVDRLPPKYSGPQSVSDGKPDLIYHLQISEGQALAGTVVQVDLPHIDAGRRVSVRIPPGVKTGTRLRLKEMGNALPENPLRRGDVYLELRIASY